MAVLFAAQSQLHSLAVFGSALADCVSKRPAEGNCRVGELQPAMSLTGSAPMFLFVLICQEQKEN